MVYGLATDVLVGHRDPLMLLAVTKEQEKSSCCPRRTAKVNPRATLHVTYGAEI